MRTLVVIVLLFCASTAHAFSDPAMFGMSAAEGGGGGRYFTGSRIDPYSCSVCHTGGKEPNVVIDGIPDTPVAGQRYELVVHWDQPEVPLALQLELSTPSASHPTVEVLPDADLPPESRCDQSPTGLPAVYAIDAGVRRIVGVTDCNAERLDVSFIANGEPIVLAIGAVRSDGSGTVDGDGTYERRYELGTTLVARGGGGCDAGGGPARWPLLLVVFAVLRRRRRQGSSRPRSTVISIAHT